jgi:hypothetical protein
MATLSEGEELCVPPLCPLSVLGKSLLSSGNHRDAENTEEAQTTSEWAEK